MKKILLFSLFISCFSFWASADVAIEGEFDLRFRITNLDEFPDYEFEYPFQTYYYEYGYQPGEVEYVAILPDSAYYSGGRGDRTKIVALSKSAEFEDAESDMEIGGTIQEGNRDVRSITQLIRITSIREGVVNYEITGLEYEYRDGKVKQKKYKEIFGGFLDNNQWLLYGLIPAISLLSLVMLFLMRKRRSSPVEHGLGPA